MLLQQREHLHLSKTPPESEVTNTKVFSFRSRQTTALENNTKAIQGKSVETIPRSHRKSTASSFLFVARLGIRLKAGLQLWKLSSAQVALFFCSCESFWRGLGRFWCQKYNPIQPKRPILATLTCNPAHDFLLRTENSRQPCRARLEPARNLLGIGILQVNTDRPPESGIVARKITRYAEPPKHCPRRLPEADVRPRHCGLVLGRRQGRGYRRIPPWTNGGVRGVEV